MTRRCATLAVLDLLLVSALLGIFGSSPWAWLAGPITALAIVSLECSARPASVSRVQAVEVPVADGRTGNPRVLTTAPTSGA